MTNPFEEWCPLDEIENMLPKLLPEVQKPGYYGLNIGPARTLEAVRMIPDIIKVCYSGSVLIIE